MESTDHGLGGGGPLADAGGDPDAAVGGSGHHDARRLATETIVDAGDEVEVARLMLGEPALPAGHPGLGRPAGEPHRLAQFGESALDELVVGPPCAALVPVATERGPQHHLAGDVCVGPLGRRPRAGGDRSLLGLRHEVAAAVETTADVTLGEREGDDGHRGVFDRADHRRRRGGDGDQLVGGHERGCRDDHGVGIDIGDPPSTLVADGRDAIDRRPRS